MLFIVFDIDSIIDKSMYYEWNGDFSSVVWEAKPGTNLNTARYDDAWFSTGDAFLVAGGWKSAYNMKLQKAVYNGLKNRWMALSNKTIDEEVTAVLRSVSIGISEKNIAFLGVVSCTVNDTILGLKIYGRIGKKYLNLAMKDTKMVFFCIVIYLLDRNDLLCFKVRLP